MVIVAPIEATMMAPMASHWRKVRYSPRNTNPYNAPTAGSRLIRVPNVFAGSLVIAAISSE